MTEILPFTRMRQEIFLTSLPSELFEFIFNHSSLLTLMRLSATSRKLRLEVHNFFTSRLSDQSKKYPEVRDSLSMIGWTKKHDYWTCDCFTLVAGPGFTRDQLTKRKSFSPVSRARDFIKDMTCTIVAGKTFLLTSGREIVFFENSTENLTMRNSPRSLVSFESSQEVVLGALSSYDQVLAFSIKKPAPNAQHTICIYNTTTLSKVAEIDLVEYDSQIPEDICDVKINFISFAKNTMAIHLDGYGAIHYDGDFEGDGRNILLWKLNTNEPKEEGIAFLHTVAPPPDFMRSVLPFGTFSLNDRFIAIIEDTRVDVLRRTDGALVRQIGEGGSWDLAQWALESAGGDHIAFARAFTHNVDHPKLVIQINSITQGRIIVRKELVEWPFPNVQYLKWFGPHLIVVLEKDNMLSMMSWQPGLSSFLTCPFNISVVRRTSRDNGGAVPEVNPFVEFLVHLRGGRLAPKWAADCFHVDYGGITLALKKDMWDFKNHVWRYE